LLASSVAHQNQDTVWLTRLGDYQLADSDFPDSKLLRLGPARLTEEDGIYCVAITFNDEELVLPLAFHTNDEATIQGYGRNHGETLRFISDNTFQLLGLRFTRTKAD